MSKRDYLILVADDEIAVVRSTNDYLLRIAAQLKIVLHLYSATSGSEVLQTLAEHPIDIVFLDYHFDGGMNGDEIIDNMIDPFGDTLIVLMSAWEQKDLQRVIFKRTQNLGERFKFLRKPFEFVEIQARFLEINNFFLDRPYPRPLAHAMSVMESRTTEQGRLSSMKDVVETVLKYSSVILMADVIRTGLHRSVDWGINWQLNLTMGAWIKILQKLLEKFSEHQAALFMPELYQLFFDSAAKPTEVFNRLFQFKDDLRDPVIGHGPTLDEGAYQLLANNYENYVRTLYGDTYFMSKYYLMVVNKADFSNPTSDVIEYKVRTLMGLETTSKLSDWNSKHRLPAGKVYVHRRNGEVLSLYPFVLVAACPICMAERLFVLDNVTAHALQHKALCNHPYVDSTAKQMVEGMFNDD